MKKGLKTLIAGILLFFVGPIIVPIVFILPILLDAMQGNFKERQFIIPGELEIEIAEPGRYYLWNDYKTVFEGKSYNRSESIPDGLEIKVADQDGRNLALIGHSSISSSTGHASKNSIGYVEVSSPCKLTVTVSGSSDDRVFSFSQSGITKIVGLVFAGFGFSMLFAAAGLGLSIWGIVKMTKEKKLGEQSTGAS